VVDLNDGAGVGGAVVQAVRAPEDAIEVSQSTTTDDGSFVLGGLQQGRYFLRVSKFGWRTLSVKAPVSAPAQRVTLKLVQLNVIRGLVVDADGAPEPNATVLMSSLPDHPPIVWPTDDEGRFQQPHFAAGTYYLWAKRGEMLAYPPVRIELGDRQEQDVRLMLTHRGARVIGRVMTQDPERPELTVRLVSRSPLSFPRPAVAKASSDGAFVLSPVLPGRYELHVSAGARRMAIEKGPRDVEIPIEPGSTISLRDPLLVRPQAAE
jgi:hypothetical protein